MSVQEQQNEIDGLGAGESSSPGEAAKAGYQVGYKRPPLHTRFPPGQSGNPKGRPKGTPNHKTTICKVMNEKVTLREGGKIRRVTKLEAILQSQTNKGMKGDARSAGMVINVMAKVGLLDDEGEAIKVKGSTAKAAPNLTEEQAEPRPGDVLFANIEEDLLNSDERADLAIYAEWIDARGFGGLTTEAFERIKEILIKCYKKDRDAA